MGTYDSNFLEKTAEIITGIGDVVVGYEGDILVSLSLGSCVGVALYDPNVKIGAMAHIMLPDSTKCIDNFNPERKVMIAETDALIKDRLKNILVKRNYEIVAEARNAEESLNQYKQFYPKASLVSAFLPPNNATEFLKSLLSFDKDANILVLSPIIGIEKIKEYLSNGARDVINEPFTETKVINYLEPIVLPSLLRFADRAIPIMLSKIINLGGNEKNIVAKIAGGARIYSNLENKPYFDIGPRNTAAVKEILKQHNIPIISEDTGGNIGRTLKFDVATSKLTIRSKDGIREI